MKKLVTLLTVCSLALAGSYALVSAGQAEDIYRKCKGCHGADGSKVPPGSSEQYVVKGKSKDVLLKAMHGYVDGTYGGSKAVIMKAQLKTLSDAEIEALAEYMAAF